MLVYQRWIIEHPMKVYSTWRKGTSYSNIPLVGNMLVPRRVPFSIKCYIEQVRKVSFHIPLFVPSSCGENPGFRKLPFVKSVRDSRGIFSAKEHALFKIIMFYFHCTCHPCMDKIQTHHKPGPFLRQIPIQ